MAPEPRPDIISLNMPEAKITSPLPEVKLIPPRNQETTPSSPEEERPNLPVNETVLWVNPSAESQTPDLYSLTQTSELLGFSALEVGASAVSHIERRALAKLKENLLPLHHAQFTFSPQTRRLTLNGQEYPIGPVTSRALAALMKRPNRLIRHRELQQQVCGKNHQKDASNTIRYSMRALRLRLKQIGLDPNLIVSVPSEGYSLQDESLTDQLIVLTEDLVYDPDRRFLLVADARKPLGPLENSLLGYLTSNRGQPQTPEQIARRLWRRRPRDWRNVIRTHVHHLRRKLDPDTQYSHNHYIQNRSQLGYWWGKLATSNNPWVEFKQLLTPQEIKLLQYLIINPGQFLTYNQLADHLWGPDDVDHNVETVRSHIHHLQAKLDSRKLHPRDHYIVNKPGIGYMLRHPREFAADSKPPRGGLIK